MKRVYFLLCESSPSFIKIGASIVPMSRQKTIGLFLPFETRLLAETDGSHCLEAALQRHFAEHRVRGEWFRDCAPIRDVVASIEDGTFDPVPFVRRELSDFVGLRARYFSLRRGPFPEAGRLLAIPDSCVAKKMPPAQLQRWIDRLTRFLAAAEQGIAA